MLLLCVCMDFKHLERGALSVSHMQLGSYSGGGGGGRGGNLISVLEGEQGERTSERSQPLPPV